MATVLLWEPVGCWGHCSMQFDEGDYFSFWPEDDYGAIDFLIAKDVPSKLHLFYEEDKNAEGRDADKRISLKSDLDKKKFRAWWDKNKHSNYNAGGGWHCSSIIQNGLRAAGYRDKELYDELAEWLGRVMKSTKASKGKK